MPGTSGAKTRFALLSGHEIRVEARKCRSGLKVISTISWSARVPPAASWPTGSRPIPKNRVLILEAGGNDNWIWFHIPVGYLFAIGNPRSDWMFKTEPEPGLNGRALAYPRGKVIGGSSAINAMISMRGQAADYDHWRQLGLTGWGYDDVMPLFKRLEDHFLGESEHHGTGGGWRIEAPRLSWEVLDAVGDAAEEMGIKRIADFNTGDNEGTSYFHVNQKRGRRWSSARGFLKPVLNRGNLRLEKNVLVDRLIIENGRAVGVRFMQGNEVIEARTKGEVILCAGSIGSTQVLHRSGIGPSDWLSPLGIDVTLDRQGVGRNLQDHLQQRAIYKVEGVRTLNETYYNLIRRGMMGLDYAFRRRGPLTMAPSQLGIFTRSDPHRERANIQFHVQPLSLDKFGDPLHRFPAITVSACNLQPTSRGTVRIRSAKPDEAPSIAPNYLSTDDDRQVAADAIRTTRRLMKQKRLERYHPQEYLPGPSVGDDDASLAKAAGDIGTTIFHPVGTAKMGTASDPLAVVDERLRFSRHRGLARRRCFGDADDHVGQHQHADGDDRGERCCDDPGGCAVVPPMTNPKRISVGPVGEHIALARWGEDGSGKPPALLLHGTGFVAEVWDEVARELASRYTVYALDRRGHGDSHKPAADRYHFQDFAEDLCRVIETLDLSDIFGIGHSAGATDLLLAAKLLPKRFSRLFVMEPTVMDPRAIRADGAGLSDRSTAAVQSVLRRQAEFDSAETVFQRYRAAPAFAAWSESSLWAYIRHGFAPLRDGRVRLLCTPEIESAITAPDL